MPLSATDARALFARLASVDDPCARRGRRHSQRSLLAIVLCAVISGAQGPTAIAEWGRRLPPPMLRCRRAVDGRYEPPPSPRSAVCSRPSISRRLRRHWGDCQQMPQTTVDEPVALDGKTLRGSQDGGDGPPPSGTQAAWSRRRGRWP
ncbi:MAG: transposase family protein [Acidiferrobacter thiooxydans]|nr:transposase family protein [Gammaproteobacteria bacterium]